MKTPEQTIREACIKANPEIVELKFGCEVVTEAEWTLDWGYKSKSFIFITESGGGPIGESGDFEDYHLELAEKGHGYTLVLDVRPEWVIIGRNIRLADVLLALEGAGATLSVDTIGDFYDDNGQEMGDDVRWNLRKDSLSDQDEPAKVFIANLLK